MIFGRNEMKRIHIVYEMYLKIYENFSIDVYCSVENHGVSFLCHSIIGKIEIHGYRSKVQMTVNIQV